MAIEVDYDALLQAIAPPADQPTAAQNTGFLGDVGTAVEQGLYNIPSALTGLADIPFALTTGTRPISTAADWLGDKTGLDFDQWAKDQEAEYSPQYKAQQAEVNAAEGWDVVPAWLSNPRVAVGDIAGSLPAIFAGGGLGYAARLARPVTSALAAAGIGEGAIMAGQSAADMEQAGVDPRLAALLSAGVGTTGALIGVAGGTLARRAGVDDPEVFLQRFFGNEIKEEAAENAAEEATRRLAAEAANLTGRQRLAGAAGLTVAGGALEGAEEFAQSAAEGAAMNIGTGAPIEEGLLTQGLRGALAGVGLGAGTNVASQAKRELNRRKATATVAQQEADEEAAAQEAAEAAEAAAQEAAAEEAARTARDEEIAALADRKNPNGFGPKARERLGNLDEIDTKEQLEERMSKLSKTAKEAVRNTEYYKNLDKQADLDAQSRTDVEQQSQAGFSEEEDNARAYQQEQSELEETISAAFDEEGDFLTDEERELFREVQPREAGVAGEGFSTVKPLSAEQERRDMGLAPEKDTKLTVGAVVSESIGDTSKKTQLGNRAIQGLANLLNGFDKVGVDKSRRRKLHESRLLLEETRAKLTDVMGDILTGKGRRVSAEWRQQPDREPIAQLIELIDRFKVPGAKALETTETGGNVDAAEQMLLVNKPKIRRAVTMAVRATRAAVDEGTLTEKQGRYLARLAGIYYSSFDYSPVKADKNRYDSARRLLTDSKDPNDATAADKVEAVLARISALTSQYEGTFRALGPNRTAEVVTDEDTGDKSVRVTNLGRDVSAGDFEPDVAETGAERQGATEAELEAVQALTQGAGDYTGTTGIREQLQDAFDELVDLIGINNVAEVERVSKNATTGPVGLGGNEKPSAVRFSQLYGVYIRNDRTIPAEGNMDMPQRFVDRRGRKGSAGRLTESGEVIDNDSESNALRWVDNDRVVEFDPNGGSTARRYDRGYVPEPRPGDPDYVAPLKLEKDIKAAQEKYGKKDPLNKHPVMAYLMHLQNTKVGSPYTAVLSGYLHRLLATKGGQEMLASLRLELYGKGDPTKPTNPYGAGGSYVPPATGKVGGVISLYNNEGRREHSKEGQKKYGSVSGFTASTFLHEVIHAATVNMMLKPPRSLSKTQKAAIAQMKVLTGAVAKVIRKRYSEAERAGEAEKVEWYNNLNESLLAFDKTSHTEFVTHAMTSVHMRTFLKELNMSDLDSADRKAIEAATAGMRKLRSRNLWARFVQTIKGLLDIDAKIPDSVFARFVDAQGDLLGEVYVAAHKDSKVFKASENWKKRVRFESANPETIGNTPQGRAQKEAASKRLEQERRQRQETKRAAEATSRSNRVKQGEANQEYVAAEEAATATSVPGKKVISNVFLVSRMEEAIFNFVTRMVSNYNTYQEAVDDGFERVGTGIINFVKDPKNKHAWLSRQVGRMLTLVVDEFGVPRAYKGIAHNTEAKLDGIMSRTGELATTLSVMDKKTQDGLAAYLQTPDPQTLRDLYPGDTALQEAVQRTYAKLSSMQQELAALGLLSKKDQARPIYDFLEFSQKGHVRFKPGFTAGKATPAGANEYIRDPDIPFTRVVDKNGKAYDDSDPAPGTKFYQMALETPVEGVSVMYVEVGAPASVWAALKVVPTNDSNPYVHKYDAEKTSITMERRKTLDEIREAEGLANQTKGRPVAQVTAALANLAQDWGRRIEGAKFIAALENVNGADGDVFIINPLPKPDGISDKEWDNYPSESHRPEALRGLPPDRVVRHNDPADKDWRKKARLPGTWVYIPLGEPDSPTRAQFGTMAGRYVAGPVYSSIMDYQDNSPVIDSATFRQTMRMWKKNKTVYSPAAHVNNMTSNFILASFHDIPPQNIGLAAAFVMLEMYPRSPKLQRLARRLEAKHGVSFDAMREEKLNAGITLGQMKTADIDVESERAVEDMLRNIEENSPRATIRMLTKYMRVAANNANDWYSNQDNIFRFAAYMTHLQNYGNVQPDGRLGLEPAEAAKVKQNAALFAKEAFVNYRVHAPLIRKGKETLTPFITWSYRMAPLMTKLMLQKPWKAMNTIAGIYAINAIGYALSGGDEDEERGLLPGYMQKEVDWLQWAPVDVPTTIRLPWMEDDGDSPMFLNAARMIPLADYFEVNNAGTPQAIAFGGPLSVLMSLNSNYDPFRGRDISDPAMPLEQRAMDYLKFGLAATMPGFAVNTASAVGKATSTKPLGTRYDASTQFAKLLGFNAYHMDIPEAAYAKSQEVEFIKRNYQTQINKRTKTLMRSLNPDYNEIAYTQQQMQEDMMRAVAEAYNVDPKEYGLD